MPNTTKLYQDGSNMLLSTNNGNYIIKNDGIYETTRNGEGLTKLPSDTTAQAAFDNATAASDTRLSVDACNALCILVNEKMEDFD